MRCKRLIRCRVCWYEWWSVRCHIIRRGKGWLSRWIPSYIGRSECKLFPIEWDEFLRSYEVNSVQVRFFAFLWRKWPLMKVRMCAHVRYRATDIQCWRASPYCDSHKSIWQSCSLLCAFFLNCMLDMTDDDRSKFVIVSNFAYLFLNINLHWLTMVVHVGEFLYKHYSNFIIFLYSIYTTSSKVLFLFAWSTRKFNM